MTEEQPEPETWEEMSARVTNEVINLGYATSLMNSFKAYLSVGFPHEQAFRLLLSEHDARLEMMNSRALLIEGYTQIDPDSLDP